MSVEWWQDGDKGWRAEAEDLAEVTLVAQSICKEMQIPYDPASVLVFADYEGNLRLNLRGLRWKFDEQKGIFKIERQLNV